MYRSFNQQCSVVNLYVIIFILRWTHEFNELSFEYPTESIASHLRGRNTWNWILPSYICLFSFFKEFNWSISLESIRRLHLHISWRPRKAPSLRVMAATVVFLASIPSSKFSSFPISFSPFIRLVPLPPS